MKRAKTLEELIDSARLIKMTPEQRREQRIRFAYGNLKLHNPDITREDVERAAEEVDKGVGVAVYCTTCELWKKPNGRDAAAIIANSLCDRDCPGYMEEPLPGHLWPGEKQEDYGY